MPRCPPDCSLRCRVHFPRRAIRILAVAALAVFAFRMPAAGRPNIIVFLADDLGYGDVGVNGCPDVPTPNVDAIAQKGVRFTAGYATHPVCSPSRAGLLSGRYQHRFGFEHNSGPERFAAPNFGLPRSEATLAERLKALGYATGMVGKWHIGFTPGLRPHERGFDYFFGFLSGAHTYLPGAPDFNPIYRNTAIVDEKEYLTDAFAREAVAFTGQHDRRPFFLYVAFNAVHSPLDENPYQERFTAITDRRRRIYAGMLAAMDAAVGRIMASVRALGQEENTLVFFYSDNGGPTGETTSRNDPLRGFKTQVFEGGIRVPFLAQWPGILPAGTVYRQPVMAFDIHATALIAAGGALPKEKPLDGVDLVPFLTRQTDRAPHERLFWRAGQQWAVRMGDWKLVNARTAAPELYNLRADVGESTNLAAQEPERARELQLAYNAWSAQMMSPQWVRQDGRTAGKAGKKKADGAIPGVDRIAQVFRSSDDNGDGKLSAEEYPQPAIFEDVDANHDGFVTIEEIRTYYSVRRAKTGAGKTK